MFRPQLDRLFLVSVFLCVSGLATRADERLTVHEWGTFTTLQDDLGNELPGINIDDEPVPDFVYNLSPFLLNSPLTSNIHWQYRQKAAPRQHPYVTMRLETPVIYFHLPPGQAKPINVDVSVQFRGGWLTEFYPHARASAPGLKEGVFDFGAITPDTVGGLVWEDLRVGVEPRGPETDEHVWLAPRDVAAAGVATPVGESEHYLFYRGVANLRAPLRVATERPTGDMTLFGNFDQVLSSDERIPVGALWLVHIREDGKTAFRTLPKIEVTRDRKQPLSAFSGSFADGDYGAGNLETLNRHMHRALVADGLFADEATALLATWKRAYFTTPGLRLFYLVPRRWTDHYLPLSLSQEADIRRVMVGRIELFTERQHRLLARLAATATSDGKWIDEIPKSAARERFLVGRTDFGDLGVAIPPDYQMYLALGRFRNALVTYQERRRPTPQLRQFINTYGLHPYRWPDLQPDRDSPVTTATPPPPSPTGPTGGSSAGRGGRLRYPASITTSSCPLILDLLERSR